MANEKNLVPNDKRTPRERRENAKKAGQASGEARRKKRLLKEYMVDLLNLPVTKQKDFNRLAKLGIDAENMDNKALLTAALFSKAVECGDVKAFKEILNLIGENRTDGTDGIETLIEGLKHDEE